MTIAAVLLLILLLIVLLLWTLLTSGPSGDEPVLVAPTSASPSASTPSSRTSGPVDGRPTEGLTTELPPTGVPATGAGNGNGSPGAGAPGLPPFDVSEVEVLSNGTMRLALNSYGSQLDSQYGWRSARGYGGGPDGDGSELTFVDSGIVGQEGTQLARLDDRVPKSFPTCQGQRAWSPALTWDQVSQGTFVCIKTPDGRRAMLRVDEMPNMAKTEPTVLVTGVTWEPVVDE